MKTTLITIVIAYCSIIASAQNQVEDLNMGTYQLQFLSSSGGNNRIQSYGGNSTNVWLFKSRFDNITLDAGENSSNNRRILFKIGGVEKARINSNGFVGIGTLSPQYLLHAEGEVFFKKLRMGGDAYLGTNQLQFLSSSGGNNRIQSYGGSTNTWLFKSRFDNITLDAGENSSNNRKIIFMIGGIEKARFNTNGSLGLGTVTTGSHKLAVEGSIGAREIQVEANGWSDFVFEKEYELRSLEETEQFILKNKHLPEIPNEEAIEKEGINLGQMDAKLLQKIEELTLYLIEQNKLNQRLQERVTQLEKEMTSLNKK
nr:hypothetical protein [uncultured Draconibacterium sp.]